MVQVALKSGVNLAKAGLDDVKNLPAAVKIIQKTLSAAPKSQQGAVLKQLATNASFAKDTVSGTSVPASAVQAVAKVVSVVKK